MDFLSTPLVRSRLDLFLTCEEQSLDPFFASGSRVDPLPTCVGVGVGSEVFRVDLCWSTGKYDCKNISHRSLKWEGGGLNPSIHIYFFCKNRHINNELFLLVKFPPPPFNLLPKLMTSVVDAYLFHKSVEYIAGTFNLFCTNYTVIIRYG